MRGEVRGRGGSGVPSCCWESIGFRLWQWRTHVAWTRIGPGPSRHSVNLSLHLQARATSGQGSKMEHGC